MNISKYIIAILVGFVCLVANSTSALSNGVDYDGYLREYVSEDVLEHRINSIESMVDIRVTEEIKSIIRQYTLSNRKASEIVLGKTPVYFPLFEKIFRSADLPDELKYLSVVESGLQPNARSSVGATGLWQFMKKTGKMYGLKINNSVDQRKDPTLSTNAAAKFLKDLYGQFDNWTLALAAYNCGPGNVRKAIRRSGSRDYWVLQKYLPKETRRYIPKFIAMIYLNEYYTSHDLKPILVGNDFQNILRLKVTSKISFKELSTITGMSLSDLKRINPSYNYGYIKASGNNYLNLPNESMFLYLLNKDILSHDVYSFYGNEKINFGVKMEDKPTKIDNRLKEITPLSILGVKRVITGSKRSLPVLQSTDIISTQLYRIRKGETVLDVAMRLNLKLEDLIRWNHIDMNNLPTPGTMITLSKL